MYIYRFTISYFDGTVKVEHIVPDNQETIAMCEKRAEEYLDSLEADLNVQSVHYKRRTLPMI